MGRGGQDEPAGEPGITSDEKKGGVMSCGPFRFFPCRSVVEMPDIRGASRLLIFSVFRLRGNPILN